MGETKMQIVGYASTWTARPGDAIGLHVSCKSQNYNVSLVRLLHGDTNPAGPGFRANSIACSIEGRLPGSWHDVASGSYAIVEDAGPLLNEPVTTIAAWIFPTLPGSKKQVVLSRGEDGFCLAIDTDGRPVAQVGSTVLHSSDPLIANQWYNLIVRIDRRTSVVELSVHPRDTWPSKVRSSTARKSANDIGAFSGPLVIAAHETSAGTIDHFNGKIDSPTIFSDWLLDDDVALLFSQNSLTQSQAHWDFGADHGSLIIPSHTGGREARLVGMPTRAVTGHRANGNALRPSDCPNHYTAIHFHDDDKDDARWPEAASLMIANDWDSGIYAFHLQTDDGHEDYVPFFVLPAREGPHASIAFLAPTFSYTAYGNVHYSHLALDPELEKMLPEKHSPHDIYIKTQRLNSTYDLHTDGSGVSHVSRLLPQVNVRPNQDSGNGSPHQFNADLHLVDWLNVKGFEHDVITDEALHHDGLEILKPYNVILTGTHPEYWSGTMLDSVQSYLRNGGRIMYMGGNGFYWVTSVHPIVPHVLEIRKYGGTRTWTAQPDERHHATTGEQGGIWRDRGRAPQKMLGVGFAGQGFGTNGKYRRTAASFTGPLSDLFDGIEAEVIGDTPSLVLDHNAAGFELDRIDQALGSPPNTICLARSFDHGDQYQVAYEEALASMIPAQLGSTNPNLHGDISYLEYPRGGAVFSTGSISYCGSLSYNAYDNDISRLTENVLRKFNNTSNDMFDKTKS